MRSYLPGNRVHLGLRETFELPNFFGIVGSDPVAKHLICRVHMHCSATIDEPSEAVTGSERPPPLTNPRIRSVGETLGSFSLRPISNSPIRHRLMLEPLDERYGQPQTSGIGAVSTVEVTGPRLGR